MDNATTYDACFENITLEAILSKDNLLRALERVEKGKDKAPGVDGMETHELRDYFYQNPGALTSAVRNGTYKPSPLKRVTIPKAEKGKFRNLGIPTVIDRFLQTAIAQVMDLPYDCTFSPESYGYRQGRQANFAAAYAAELANQGYVWVVDLDLEKFFDTVDQSKMIEKLSRRIKDGRVISLIHKMLRAGVMIDGEIEPTDVGLMQGGPLSPLLANIYLDELDKELNQRGHQFVRYADDMMILCKTKRAAQRTYGSIRRFIEKRLRLKVNEEKSGVHYITRVAKFLGYAFAHVGKRIVLTVSKKKRQQLKDELRQVLARNRKASIDDIKTKLEQKLRGWTAYFFLAYYRKWVIDELDPWIRRRIRMLLWTTWKRVRTRYKALRKLGCDHETAIQWANTRKGYWRIAHSQILLTTLTNDFLKNHGWTWAHLCLPELSVWK